MERKLLTPDFKISDDGSGSLKGYASTFSNWDDVKERPVKGAFIPHLADFLKDGFIAVGHDWSALPIATPSIAREDDIGLYLEADFHTTAMAQDARTVASERLARNKSVKLSIGYEVLQDEYVEEGRLLKEIKLYEVSLVTVPANPLASVTGVKQLQLEGGPLSAYADTVEAAISMFKKEARALEGRRAKEGRVLSDTNRKRIQTLLEALISVQSDLADLLVSAEPKAAVDVDVVKGLHFEFLRLQSQLNGVRL